MTRLLLTALLAMPFAAQTAEPDRAAVEAEVMAVLDEFIETFSARDPVGHTATYHFPHFRLARGVMSSFPTRADAIERHEEVFRTLPETGWDRSVWVHWRIVTLSPSKVHVDTRFARLREDGSEIGQYDSLYVLIKQDGRWGIKLRSSFL